MTTRCPACGHPTGPRMRPTAQVVLGHATAADAPVLTRAWRAALATLTDQWQRRVDVIAAAAAQAGCSASTVEALLIEAARHNLIDTSYEVTDRRRALIRQPTSRKRGAGGPPTPTHPEENRP